MVTAVFFLALESNLGFGYAGAFVWE